jgi:hypothetical protein
MRLRTRFAAEIKTRLLALLPEAVATVWDAQVVLVAVEKIAFTSAGGLEGEWERRARMTGVVRVELRADVIDAQEVEPLIADLLARTVFLDYAPDTALGEMSEKARFELSDWRDTLRDAQLISALRFNVDAALATYTGPAQRPDLLISQAPEIGPGQEGEYAPIAEAAA